MTVFGITFAGLVRSRRTFALGLLPLLGVVVAIGIAAAAEDPGVDDYGGYVGGLVLPVVTAFVALVLGASALTEQREDRTILYLAQTPLPRVRIAAETWLAAWLASVLVVSPAVIAGIVLGVRVDVPGRAFAGLVAGVVLAAGAYTALAVLLGLLTRRAVIVGMLYVLLWEGSVASVATSADRISIAAYGRRVAAAGIEGTMDPAPPDVGAVVAIAVLALAALVSVALAGRRLGRMELP